MLSPGTAFLLAYLPARRVAHTARLELLDRNAATIDPALKHAIEFSRHALKVEESMVADTDARLADLARQNGVAPGAMPPLATPVLQAAWKAGETARVVAISVALAAHVAYLRCAAPDNADLRAQAADRARDLKESAAALQVQLEATELPLVISHAGSVLQMVNLTSSLEPTTTGGYRELNELARDLNNFLEATARQLDVAPPERPSAAPTAEEEALLARILATPSNHGLRGELATLAARRNDPRAALIRLQLSPGATPTQVNDLIRSHPEWTKPLVDLGARDIKFEAGFPDEITIDADVWLRRGTELVATAPLTRLHVRNAKGRVGEVVRSPLLATIEALDLDDQAVSDDDVIALAGSPHAAHLRQLDLRYNPISERGITALAASPHLEKLERVHLDGNPADPVDRLEYYDETNQHAVPTEAGKALEATYGRLRWLHPH